MSVVIGAMDFISGRNLAATFDVFKTPVLKLKENGKDFQEIYVIGEASIKLAIGEVFHSKFPSFTLHLHHDSIDWIKLKYFPRSIGWS